MPSIIELRALINSMSKAEKRHFRLNSAMQKGTKDYLVLFELFLSGKEAIDIPSQFIEKLPHGSYYMTSSYLFNLILDTLLHLQREKDLIVSLTTDLLQAIILFERGIYEEGQRRIHKVQNRSKEAGLHLIHAWSAMIEIDSITGLGFHTVSETELTQKHTKLQLTHKYIQQVIQHKSLYQLMHHRLLYRGPARTIGQKDELNDLLVSELAIVSRHSLESFEDRKTHLLFQAYYLISTGDSKAALRAFTEIITLYETEQNMLDFPLPEFINTIDGILKSLHSIRNFEGMTFFIDKLSAMKNVPELQATDIDRIKYVYGVIKLLERGDFEEARILYADFSHSLFKKIALLDPGRQAEIYLYTSLVFIMCGKPELANASLNKILLGGNIYQRLPIYRTFRLINLLVHYELGNHDYISYEIRSIKRSISEKDKKAYQLEKIVFSFLNVRTMPVLTKDRNILWNRYQKKIQMIAADRYEQQILNIFNFGSWIGTKIFSISWKDLLEKPI